MKAAHDIRPITHLKTHAAEVISSVAGTGRTVTITQNGRARAVVMDVETYEGWKDALAILKLAAQGDAEITRGRSRPQREVFARLRERLRAPG